MGLAGCGGAEAPAPIVAEPAAPVAESVDISDAFVRAMPAAAPNSALFMTLTNTRDATALVAVEGTAAKSIELHTHTADEAGVMRMRKIDQVDLPARQAVALKPGGLHVMLIGLNHPVTAGAQEHFTLIFKDGSRKLLTAPVRAVE